MEGTKESCLCDRCKEACLDKPGWFMPGEAEIAAARLGVSLKELFDTKLAVDWWVGDEEDIFLLSPALVGELAGTEFPCDPRGTCVFFRDGLCQIHQAKPYECKEAFHDDYDVVKERHKQVARAWEPYQGLIVELLGRPPESQTFTLYDALGFGDFGSWW